MIVHQTPVAALEPGATAAVLAAGGGVGGGGASSHGGIGSSVAGGQLWSSLTSGK